MTDTATVEAGTDKKAGADEPKNYLILGCGPAALIAAHTLQQNGVDPDNFCIISRERKPSEIGGAQFLHRPLLDPTAAPDGVISIMRMGDAPGYANKVYGSSSTPTSFISGEVRVDAWSLIKVYEKLWEDYAPSIEERDVNAEVFAELIQGGEYTEIISTIPPMSYCSNPTHIFESVPIIIGEPIDPLPMDNAIVYSGRPEDGWYRMSSLFGEDGIEVGSAGEPLVNPEMEEVATKYIWPDSRHLGLKPLRTTCECGFVHPDTSLLRVGRFGMWDRRRLLHQVPAQVASIL